MTDYLKDKVRGIRLWPRHLHNAAASNVSGAGVKMAVGRLRRHGGPSVKVWGSQGSYPLAADIGLT